MTLSNDPFVAFHDSHQIRQFESGHEGDVTSALAPSATLDKMRAAETPAETNTPISGFGDAGV